jgi:uncharacterized protein
MTRPGEPHVPIRTCIGCRERRPQTELLRCVLADVGTILVDRTAPGRGAWLCGPGCLTEPHQRRAFDRAWRTKVSPAAIDRVILELTN